MKRFKLLILLFTPMLAFAQDESVGFIEQYLLEIVLTVVVFATLVALIAVIISYSALKSVLDMKSDKAGAPRQSFWERFYTSFNRAAPVGQEASVLTDHEYDGIRELDNKLPPWWLYGFYVTIIFSAIYLLHYHVFGTGPSSAEEYVMEMQKAEEEVQAYLATQGTLIDETNVELLMDEASLATGKEMYLQSCSVCHGQGGEGGIGPNFADNYWIHGGDVKSVFSVIKYGVPTKGMISWQNQFNATQMQQLSSFIISLEGTNPPNQKEPQGEIYDRQATEGGEETEGATTL